MKIILTESQLKILMNQTINEDLLDKYGEVIDPIIEYLGNLMNKMGFEKFLDKYGNFVENLFGSISNFLKSLKKKNIEESFNKNKKLINKITGFDFTSKIKEITSTYDIPMSFDDCVYGETINRYLNFWGPMYIFELEGNNYLYQDRGEFEWFMSDDENCTDYVDNEIPEQLGIAIMGLRFSDIIDMFFEDEE